MSKVLKNYRPIDPQIVSLAEKYNRDPDLILEMFHDLQREKGVITREEIRDISRALKIPASEAYGVASFYSMLNIQTEKTPVDKKFIRVCDGPVCWLKDANNVHKNLNRLLEGNPEWIVERSSCLGLCDRAPAVLIDNQQAGPLIDEKHYSMLLDGWRGESTGYSNERDGELRVMMKYAGKIDPRSFNSAVENNAYCGLANALQETPSKILQEVIDSGLTGRGGAGFPVGRKWKFVSDNPQKPKYVICNADESEPLIFKDRVLIETNPHQILEGMAIAAFATGAEHGYIYIRGEYEIQAQLLENAIAQAEMENWLGKNIQGTKFSFTIHVHRGAGAYICGEETALIESLEAKRGEPRLRPPYPPTYGYKGYPTLVNNVESFAAVPQIICNGGEWYQKLSNWRTPGTKIYLLLGHVNRPGLFEAPFGLTLRNIINNFGGGMRPGSEFNFALSGGAAGTFVSPELLDVKIDYASTSEGVSLGAGAFLVCDQSVSPVRMLRELLHFFAVESCGKCNPCRIGTHRSLEILNQIVEGKSSSDSIRELRRLSEVMKVASICGLGQSVSIPVNSALAHFEDQFRNL